MKIILISSIFLFIHLPALSFTLVSSTDSGLKGWKRGEVSIYVNTNNCPAGLDIVDLVREAAKVWNNVPHSSIKVYYGGGTTSTGATASNPPFVYCENDFSAIPGSPSDDFVAGAAYASAPAGEINAGYIFLNATTGDANLRNFDKHQVIMIIAHEIGHLLGLGHSHSKSALMYYDVSEKSHLSLSQDDMDGMAYLYPQDEFEDDAFAGCGAITAPPTPPNKFLLLLILMMPVLTYLALRFRARFRFLK